MNYYAMWNRATKLNLFIGFDAPGISQLRYGEDAVQTMMLFERADKVLFISDRLYLYRQNPASVSAVNDTVRKFKDYLIGTNLIYDIVRGGIA